MSLKMKIMLVTLLSLIVLGGLSLVLASRLILDSSYQRLYTGMHATTLAIQSGIEAGVEGEYHLDDQGKLWLGDSVNVSEFTEMVDRIHEGTGMEVTVFYGDTRCLTSIVDENGERQVGTKANDEVVNQVLHQGKDYSATDVEILGDKYIVYYIPLTQTTSDEVIGMIFLGTEQEEVVNEIHGKQQQMFLNILGIIFLTGVILFFVMSRIAGAIKKGALVVDQIAGRDLTVEVPRSLKGRKDEIGSMCKSIEHLKLELAEIMSRLRQEADYLGDSAEAVDQRCMGTKKAIDTIERAMAEIVEGSTSLAEDSTRAGQDVSDMGGVVEHTAAEIQHLEENADKMEASSVEVDTILVNLNEISENTKQAVDEIYQQTNATNESANKIRHAVNLIIEIADETNLLALNAMIESARAGEAGKGFAVVAEEIQKLAEQSSSSAETIEHAVEQLLRDSASAVESMESVREIIDKQEDGVRRTSECFTVLREGVHSCMESISVISKESEELKTIRSSVGSVVENLTAISEENAANIESTGSSIDSVAESVTELQKNAEQLDQLSHTLRGDVAQFVL